MKNIKLLIITLLLFFSNNLFSQTQGEMNEIAMKDFKKADKELNQLYKELFKMLSEKEKTVLIIAQKNWIKFRDSHCDFEVMEYEGGSIQPLIKYNCLETQTKNRIKDLKNILERYKNR